MKRQRSQSDVTSSSSKTAKVKYEQDISHVNQSSLDLEECLKRHLDYHAGPSVCEDEFPITAVVQSGQPECLRELDYNVDPNLATNKSPERPILDAAKYCETECVKILPDISLLAPSQDGYPECQKILCHNNRNLQVNRLLKFVLVTAAKNGHVECLKILLASNTDSNLSSKELRLIPLLAAARNGHPDCVKILFDYKSNQNLEKDDLQKLLLVIAAKNDYVKCLKVLLDGTFNLNWNKKLLEILLVCAVQKGHTACVNVLFDYLADLNFCINICELQPFVYAIENDFEKCLKLLDCYLADSDTFETSETPVIAAVKEGHTECAKISCDLIDHTYLFKSETSETPVIAAVKEGHTECVKLLFDDNALPHWSNSRKAPLIVAAEDGHAECVKMLLDHHADPNILVSYSPLIAASEKGHTECVRMLLEYGADPNLKGNRLSPLFGVSKSYQNSNDVSWAPLIAAAEYGHLECVKLLLRYNADPNFKVEQFPPKTPLMAAVRNGHTECAKMLLDYLTDPNVNEFCLAPLTTAAKNGHTECVKLLLGHGVNPNARGMWGTSPLIAAAENGHPECVKLLLLHHADPNLRMYCFSGFALLAAVRKGHTECVRLLLEGGADPNVTRNTDLTSPLIPAILRYDTECVKLLLDHHANPNFFENKSYSNDWVSPLHAAVSNGSLTVVKLLLDKMDLQLFVQAANHSLPHYLCPLEIAVVHGKHECLKTLLSCGFPVNSLHHTKFDLPASYYPYRYNFSSQRSPSFIPLPKCETALSLAANIGDLYSVEILLEHGASVNPVFCNIHDNEQLNFSYPPILSAIYNEQVLIVNSLIEHGCDISFHCQDIPSNMCLLFAFNYKSLFKDLLLWGSDPHQLFQDAALIVPCLSRTLRFQGQHYTLDILELVLQFTAVTGPVTRAFHVAAHRCWISRGYRFDTKRWHEILDEVRKPSSLKNLCRIKMRQWMISKHGYSSFRAAINRLCLPQMLKEYLLYHELCD